MTGRAGAAQDWLVLDIEARVRGCCEVQPKHAVCNLVSGCTVAKYRASQGASLQGRAGLRIRRRDGLGDEEDRLGRMVRYSNRRGNAELLRVPELLICT